MHAISVDEFRAQLQYLCRHYEFVTLDECLQALESGDEDFPDNAALLTFDDGYLEHFTTVCPLLEERGIQGWFFPTAKAVLHHEVLDVNKIQFILAAVPRLSDVVDDLYRWLDAYRAVYQLQSTECYVARSRQDVARQRYTSEETTVIKRLLQRELEEPARRHVVRDLFKKYVTADEAGFSSEIYMSLEQLQHMARRGMYIGSHGYDHCWLNVLAPREQREEIDRSVEFLREVGAPTDRWVMCYPYGAYNDSLIAILRERGCRMALTSRLGMARLTAENALTLERLDTNDFPKVAGAPPNAWTRQLMRIGGASTLNDSALAGRVATIEDPGDGQGTAEEADEE